MIETSFAPDAPRRAVRPRHPEESPAVVRRYLWREPSPAEPPADRADCATPPPGPRP